MVLSAKPADWQGFIDTLPYTEQDTAHYGQFKAVAEQQGVQFACFGYADSGSCQWLNTG